MEREGKSHVHVNFIAVRQKIQSYRTSVSYGENAPVSSSSVMKLRFTIGARCVSTAKLKFIGTL